MQIHPFPILDHFSFQEEQNTYTACQPPWECCLIDQIHQMQQIFVKICLERGLGCGEEWFRSLPLEASPQCELTSYLFHLGLPTASFPTRGTIWSLCSSGDEVTARQPKLPWGRELNHHRAGMQEWKTPIIRNLIILLSAPWPKKSHLNLLFISALIIWLLFLTNLVSHPHKLVLHLHSFFFSFFHFFYSNLKNKTHFIPLHAQDTGCCFQWWHLNPCCPPASGRRSCRGNPAEPGSTNCCAGNGTAPKSQPMQAAASLAQALS